LNNLKNKTEGITIGTVNLSMRIRPEVPWMLEKKLKLMSWVKKAEV